VFDARSIHCSEILKNMGRSFYQISCLVTELARRIETPPDVTAWALESPGEIVFFL